MSLLNNEIKDQLKELFGGLNNKVNIALFTSEENCESCKETVGLLSEVSETTSNLVFKKYDIVKDHKLAEELNITLTPSFALLDGQEKDHGIRFNGIPAGHEFNSFISGVLEVGGKGEALPDSFKKRIEKIEKPVHIKVFVTLGCPHCPGAVATAHKLALENENVFAEMVECGTFPEEATKYNVSGVPKIVINETNELVGNQPMEEFLNTIEGL